LAIDLAFGRAKKKKEEKKKKRERKAYRALSELAINGEGGHRKSDISRR
jgi:hypothetical protein